MRPPSFCSKEYRTNKKRRIAIRQGLLGYYKGEWHVRCAICGTDLPFSKATFDHIIPMSRGGHPTDNDNLQLLCFPCNKAKGNSLPGECKEVLS